MAVLLSCQEKQPLTATAIINNAIAASCQDGCERAQIDFDFRDKHYKSIRDQGNYQLERSFKDSIARYRDVITNNGFQRYRNDSAIVVVDSLAQQYSESVNSVHYFAQLPYGLNAPAAIKKVVGEAVINGKTYYEVEVTFQEEGGGIDFEDVFVYWIDTQTFFVDYLAYSFTVNGGGIRFREAYNPRVVEGIRFVDYNNYKPKSLDIPLNQLDELFQNEQLTLLSKIETERVEVHVLDKE